MICLNTDMELRPSSYTPLIISSLKGKKIKSILELGCGDGHNLWVVGKALKASVAGCDKDPKKDVDGVKFPFKVQSLLNSLSYEDKSFDLVMLPGVLYQIEDCSVALKEALRIAKKYILICDFRKEVNGVQWRDYKTYFPNKTIEEYPSVVHSQGAYILLIHV